MDAQRRTGSESEFSTTPAEAGDESGASPGACHCGKPVAPGRKKYCSDDCMLDANSVRMPLVPREGTRLIYELRAEVPAGLCIYCERRTNNRLTCHRPPCRTAYNTDYQAARRAAAREAPARAPLEERSCECGCQERFVPVRSNHRFATPECWERMRPPRVAKGRAHARISR